VKKPLKDILDAEPEYWTASPERLAVVCNGVGPAKWPKLARRIMDSGLLTLGMSFTASANIHDFDFSADPCCKSREHFEKVNQRFLRNNLALVRRYTPWWAWNLRRNRRHLARALYVAVKVGGWKHYMYSPQQTDG